MTGKVNIVTAVSKHQLAVTTITLTLILYK